MAESFTGKALPHRCLYQGGSLWKMCLLMHPSFSNTWFVWKRGSHGQPYMPSLFSKSCSLTSLDVLGSWGFNQAKSDLFSPPFPSFSIIFHPFPDTNGCNGCGAPAAPGDRDMRPAAAQTAPAAPAAPPASSSQTWQSKRNWFEVMKSIGNP